MEETTKERICGIYKITNLINGKMYIGQAQDIYKRWYAHKYSAFKKDNKRYNVILYRAIRKYGLENFEFEILEECCVEELNEKEIYYINKYNTCIYNKNSWGYNMTIGGDGTRGYKLSKEQLKLMSDRMKGKMIKGKNPKAKKVICENKIFDSILECAEYYNYSNSKLASYVSGRVPMPKEWYNRGLRTLDKTMDDYKIRKVYKGKNSSLSCPIICENKIFYTLEEISDYYNISQTTIWGWLNGNTSIPKEWEEKNLKYLDGHTDNIIIYRNENYFKNVHENRSKSHKGNPNKNAFKVYCEGKLFETTSKCAEYYGVNSGTMQGWVNGSDRMPKEWYDKELRREDKQMSDYEIAHKIGNRKVVCEGIVFKNAKECAEYYNIPSTSIKNWLDKIGNIPKKFYDMKLHYYDINFEDCNYKIQHGKKGEYNANSKPVLCEGVEFANARECAEHYNIIYKTMNQWLNHNNKMPKKFYDMELHYKDESMDNYEYSKKYKLVICDNKIFNSIKECAEYYNTNSTTMQKWLSGKNGMPQKFVYLGLSYYI